MDLKSNSTSPGLPFRKPRLWRLAPVLALGLLASATCPSTSGELENADAVFKNVGAYDDPLCLKWSNKCDSCSRNVRNLSEKECTKGSDECVRQYVACIDINFIALTAFCNRFSDGESNCIVDARKSHSPPPTGVYQFAAD